MPQASVAGRVMAIRDFGKGGFLRIQDRKGHHSGFLSKDVIGPRFTSSTRRTLDLGDIVFVRAE